MTNNNIINENKEILVLLNTKLSIFNNKHISIGCDSIGEPYYLEVNNNNWIPALCFVNEETGEIIYSDKDWIKELGLILTDLNTQISIIEND